jgi:hypothetical protein
MRLTIFSILYLSNQIPMHFGQQSASIPCRSIIDRFRLQTCHIMILSSFMSVNSNSYRVRYLD